MPIKAKLGLKTRQLFSLELLGLVQNTDDWVCRREAPGHQQANRRSLVYGVQNVMVTLCLGLRLYNLQFGCYVTSGSLLRIISSHQETCFLAPSFFIAHLQNSYKGHYVYKTRQHLRTWLSQGNPGKQVTAVLVFQTYQLSVQCHSVIKPFSPQIDSQSVTHPASLVLKHS